MEDLNIEPLSSEEDEVEDEDETMPFHYAITSYGADYPVDGIVQRISNGSIFIPTFQRGYVWDLKKASRFIESLLLGLPVPGIFLSREDKTQRLLVIDGQQRLRTLEFFYDGVFRPTGREFALKAVQKQYLGTTYKTLFDEDKLRLADSIIHATRVRQDEPSEDNSSIFHIFERLNTGGLQLQPQEIRVAIYHGAFNELIRKLNGNSYWRNLYGPTSKRMRDQELILRFLALYFRADKYEQTMIGFLNTYMGSNVDLKQQSEEEITKVFLPAVETANISLGNKAFRPKRALVAAIFDAVMVGLARRLERGGISELDELRQRYELLVRDEEFNKATTSETASQANVEKRIELATTAFADMQ